MGRREVAGGGRTSPRGTKKEACARARKRTFFNGFLQLLLKKSSAQ